MNQDHHTSPILIDIPMPIETPRLILRPVQPGDGTVMFEAKQETLDELQQWLPWAKDLGDVEYSELVARQKAAEYLLRTDIMLLGFEKSTGRKVVSTGLHRMNWEERYFEIGYWVRKSAMGDGYATETANALLRFAFGALNAKKVAITHAGGNEASKAVIEKLGFEEEGILKKDITLPDGTVDDHHWYARFNTDGLPDLNVKWGKDATWEPMSKS